MSTQRLLRATLAGALALLTTVVVGVWFAGWQLRSETNAADLARQDLVRIGTTRAGLGAADLAAARWLAQPDAQHRTAVAEALREALATANVSGSGSAQLEAAVTQEVVGYAMAVQSALDASGATAGERLLAAHQLLATDVTGALDNLAASRESALTASSTDYLGPAALVGSLLAIAALLLLSVLLARRVRRLVNVGLVAALAAVAAIWTLTMATEVDAVSTTRARTDLGASQVAAGAARRSEAAAIIATAHPSLLSRATTLQRADLDDLTGAVALLSDQDTFAAHLKTLESREATVLRAIPQGSVTAEAIKQLGAATTALATDAAELASLSAVELAELTDTRAGAASLIVWLAPLIGLAAATLLVVGLNQRLREYR